MFRYVRNIFLSATTLDTWAKQSKQRQLSLNLAFGLDLGIGKNFEYKMLSCIQQTLLRSLTSPMYPKITQCGFFHFTCLSNVRQAGYSYITPSRSLLPNTMQRSNSITGRAPTLFSGQGREGYCR